MTVDIWPFFLVLCILNSGAAVCFSLLFALGGGDDDDEAVGDGGGAGDDGALEYSAAPPDLFLSFIVLMLGVGTQDLTPLDSPGTSPALAKVTSRFYRDIFASSTPSRANVRPNIVFITSSDLSERDLHRRGTVLFVFHFSDTRSLLGHHIGTDRCGRDAHDDSARPPMLLPARSSSRSSSSRRT